MRQIFNRIKMDFRRFRFAGVILILYYAAARVFLHGLCPVVYFTGVPCPGCGLTRAVLFFATGQFARSFAINPAGILWIALALYFTVNRYILGRHNRRETALLLAIVASVTIGVYLYRMALYFPGPPPVSYTGNNVLSKLLPGYSEWIRHMRN